MTYMCQHHDIVLCERHKDECFGGEGCKLEPLTIDTTIVCSVCDGILAPKSRR